MLQLDRVSIRSLASRHFVAVIGGTEYICHVPWSAEDVRQARFYLRWTNLL